MQIQPINYATSAEIIDFSSNDISGTQPQSFANLKRLLSINFEDNKLIDLPADRLPVQLRILNLAANSLETIPDLSSLEDIRELSLGYNPFSTIQPDNFPPKLKVLKINCVQIEVLEDFDFYLLELESLDISCTSIYGISAKLTSISAKVLQSLSSLTHLDVSGNNLKSIPSSLPITIKTLNLADNKIFSINTACGNEQDLMSSGYLDQIGVFNDGDSMRKFAHNTELVSIDLHDNDFSNLCIDDFYGLNNLKFLNISSSKLTQIPEKMFLFTPALEVLDLSRNYLTTFKFIEISSLKYLNMAYNSIKFVSDLDTKTFPSLEVINLVNNPFRCTCENNGFIEFLTNPHGGIEIEHLSSRQHRLGYACESPPAMRGTPLFRLVSGKPLVCGGPSVGSEEFPLTAIWAPISLVCVIVAVILGVWIMRRYKIRKMQLKRFTSGLPDRIVSETGLHVHVNKTKGDAAIVCVESDRNWVLSDLLPQLKKAAQWKDFTKSK